LKRAGWQHLSRERTDLVRERESGLFFHLSCKPGAMRSGEFLSRMGAGL
jgi:hypothetical protein